jgi:glycosyltransferase involved in cell wall biosynthesis
MNQTQPLVSCITPTYNRTELLKHSIEQWLEQSYQNKELVIIDDGEKSVEKIVKKFHRPNIQYIRWQDKISIGRKRNIACEYARGEYIAHWDDDDWNHTNRLAEQANTLQVSNAAATGYNSIYIYNKPSNRAIHYYEDHYTLVGGTLMYVKNHWKTNRFPDISIGEDTYFMRRIPTSSLIPTNGLNRYVAIDGHGCNVSNRNFDQWLARYPEAKVEVVLQMIELPKKTKQSSKWIIANNPAHK